MFPKKKLHLYHRIKKHCIYPRICQLFNWTLLSIIIRILWTHQVRMMKSLLVEFRISLSVCLLLLWMNSLLFQPPRGFWFPCGTLWNPVIPGTIIVITRPLKPLRPRLTRQESRQKRDRDQSFWTSCLTLICSGWKICSNNHQNFFLSVENKRGKDQKKQTKKKKNTHKATTTEPYNQLKIGPIKRDPMANRHLVDVSNQCALTISSSKVCPESPVVLLYGFKEEYLCTRSMAKRIFTVTRAWTFCMKSKVRKIRLQVHDAIFTYCFTHWFSFQCRVQTCLSS